jgi:D-alanine-D-alanine ligase
MSSKSVLRVALIAGGTSSEREVSLKGARAVEKALRELGHKVEFFDPATDLLNLAQRAGEFDVAFLVLHGKGGEDGTIQGFLELLGLPYQGAGVLGSALAIHKGLSKKLYQLACLPVPRGETFHKGRASSKEMVEYAKWLGFPLVVKPATHGSSVGMSIVENEKELFKALDLAFSYDDEVLIEEYIQGREITGGILEEKPLPLVEIIPKESKYFDYETKYTPGKAEEVCPAPLDEKLTEKGQNYALTAHKVLKLRHYSRTDMILKDDEFFVLETNTIPGMTETSLLPLAARVAGLAFKDLVQKLLELALKKS